MRWKPITVLIAIYDAIVCCCAPKYYVYRFEIISKKAAEVDNTNVVSYRFINQGNTTAVINGGLKVVTSSTVSSLGLQVPGNDIDLGQMTFGGEIDTTIYKVRFENPPLGVIAENCLVVISKCLASERASQMEPLGGSAGRMLDKYAKKYKKNGAPVEEKEFEEIEG